MPDLFGNPTPDENLRELETNFLLKQLRKAAAPALQRAQNFTPAIGGGFNLRGFGAKGIFTNRGRKTVSDTLYNKLGQEISRRRLNSGVSTPAAHAEPGASSLTNPQIRGIEKLEDLMKKLGAQPELLINKLQNLFSGTN